MTRVALTPVAPHDFELSLRVARSFQSEPSHGGSVLSTAVRLHGQPMVLEIHQLSRVPPVVEGYTRHQQSPAEIKRIAEWIICAELDLSPFYRLAFSHPTLGPMIEELHGLKPMRPASLFEMLVIAITEQQISMGAAYSIRSRLVERYGEQVDGVWAFPTPERLSGTTIAELMKCGLSHRKAEYIRGIAGRVVSRQLDLDRLHTLPDDAVRSRLLEERGFGRWSADYILVRGLSRPDSIPADDLGIRTIVGRYLGSGPRLTARGVMRKLAPFKPYRGLAAFYLLAYARLSKLMPVDRR